MKSIETWYIDKLILAVLSTLFIYSGFTLNLFSSPTIFALSTNIHTPQHASARSYLDGLDNLGETCITKQKSLVRNYLFTSIYSIDFRKWITDSGIWSKHHHGRIWNRHNSFLTWYLDTTSSLLEGQGETLAKVSKESIV